MVVDVLFDCYVCEATLAEFELKSLAVKHAGKVGQIQVIQDELVHLQLDLVDEGRVERAAPGIE